MYYSSLTPTSEQDRNPDGTKRVYATTAYAILIDVGTHFITLEDLNQIFQAGDDAAAMQFYEVTSCFTTKDKWNIPAFGLDHHQILFVKMIEKLKQKYSL